MSTLGEEIHFVAGKHKGKKGWIDTSKTHTPKMYYVVVSNEDKGTKTATRVMKESVVDAKSVIIPSTVLEEACLQQHPDINRMMDNLAEKLAMCSVGPTERLGMIFLEKVQKANTKQLSKGKKALWYKVDRPPRPKPG
jgi:4-diphosphocytidyl-2C-methyl-D-erythritol kinase